MTSWPADFRIILRSLFDCPRVSCVAGDAGSAPCPARGNRSPGGGSGGARGAGASACSQPAAPPPVLSETEQKLTPRMTNRGIGVSKVRVTLSILYIGKHSNGGFSSPS